MGEYINYKGQQIKLGTCEDLYYVTFKQLLEMSRQCDDPNIGEYLDLDHTGTGRYRFRFPFPGETSADDFNRAQIFEWDSPCEDLGFDHGTVCHSTGSNRPKGCYNVNVMIPCPGDPKFKAWASSSGVRYSAIPSGQLIGICQQRVVNNCLWTVVECAYCWAKARLAHASGNRLASSIRYKYYNMSDQNHKWWNAVALEIERGYLVNAQELICRPIP